ncbi:hypothetical protein Acr_25g0010620 [Actinidia rufa]|uniref:Tetratricopeptide repeat (TPR)-like superfamily protein n=1 Tax=Actinidia rufa TaxID=165716 RepID=A0A7J0H0P5_9ERIC|nr:hypothetical protein Acr_25g0010620 [Actinidia rufa]
MAEKNRTYSLLSVPLNHPPRIISSSSQTPIQNPQKFPNYLENPDVSPMGRVLCEIITKTPPEGVETALSSTRIKPNSEIVEEVLKHSYGSPSAAVKFFRWAGMVQKHSGNAWTLLVDLLGKNGMFELMWDTIRSMKQEGLLTMGTFVSVFGCYCSAGKFNEAVMAFDLMERYGIQPDITPDGDTFAILLEGWEKEGNVAKAKNTFGEMVIQVGWSPQNMPAYDAFLTTLVCGSQMDEAMTFLRIMKGKNCFPVGSGLLPNLRMFNAMIGLLCNHNDIDGAFRVLDEIVFYGVFPDSLSYNMIFQCLIKNKKVREAGKFFFEMTKNEWPPTHSNCSAAITMFFNGYDPQMAVEVWDYMMKNRILPLEESANLLLIGLCDMGRLTELRRFADKNT